jgi:hypothetical protein
VEKIRLCGQEWVELVDKARKSQNKIIAYTVAWDKSQE